MLKGFGLRTMVRKAVLETIKTLESEGHFKMANIKYLEGKIELPRKRR